MLMFETRKQKLQRRLKALVPAGGLAGACVLFALAVGQASKSSLESQRVSLERALHGGAIRTYALTGMYPESLSELLDTYHIQYDPEKFIVEYTPTASNLLPSIFVIPVHASEE